MQNQRQVRLFRNGRNQAIRIPRDFEMKGNEAIIRKERNRLIIEPVGKEDMQNAIQRKIQRCDEYSRQNH